MIHFLTPGLIDLRAVTTLGVNVKEGKNPIGFFGTGMKYAIAVILRNGGCISLWRGKECFRFTEQEGTVRSKLFKFIYMNEKELGFTTDLGKNWAVWQAFRELHSNTLDEGGTTGEGFTPPSEHFTLIEVELPEFDQAYRERSKYFLSDKPLHVAQHIDLHSGPEKGIFYRGIRVSDQFHANKPLRFRTNLKRDLILTEDRTLRSQYDAIYQITESVLSSHDPEFIRAWLTAGRDYAEFDMNLELAGEQPSNTFLDVAVQCWSDTSRPVNPTVLKILTKNRGLPPLVTVELLDHEKEQLKEAKAFCTSLGYPVDEYPIFVVESLGAGVLGQASVDNKFIVLSKKAFDGGDAMLAGTLLEEWAHIKHGFYDCDRNMQNWLLDQIIRMGKAYLHVKR